MHVFGVFVNISRAFSALKCRIISIMRDSTVPLGEKALHPGPGLVPFIFPSNKWTLHPKKFSKAKRAKKFREFCQNPVFCGTRSYKHAQKVLNFEYSTFDE